MWVDTDGEGTLAEQMDRVIHNNEYANLVRTPKTNSMSLQWSAKVCNAGR